MVQVLLKGCTPVLDHHRITFVKLLQSRAHLPLKTAKECMERCILGEPVAVETPTLAVAEALAAEATRLGATAEVLGVHEPQ